MDTNGTIVLYPSPLMGHIVGMVELGKSILKHHSHSFSNITILNTTSPYLNTGSTGPYIAAVAATTPSITFHHLPAVTLPPNSTEESVEALTFEVLTLNNSNVHQAFENISKSSNIKALVIDFFCYASFEVSSKFNIPTYYFFTSPASVLSSFLYLPVIHESTTASFKDLNSFLNFPGVPPIFSSDMVKTMSDRNSLDYKYFLEMTVQLPKSCGIIVNTFESIEPRAIAAISDGLCVPNASTPPIYCVGPLIATNNVNYEEHECLIWLNSQPSHSVVFLCFGSRGLFKEEQLKEMAVGLESSGHRFLWVVRSPSKNDENEGTVVASQEPDLDALLPKGFLERTKGRGLVVKSWAPQVAVLNHDSVGGFVTHCGWNSILEAVLAGVPMIGWPLYAEQRMNRVVLVEEMKLGLNLEESEDVRFVSGAELEKRVRELMDSESGEMMRNRVMEMRDAAKDAIDKENGTSRIALAKLIAKLKE